MTNMATLLQEVRNLLDAKTIRWERILLDSDPSVEAIGYKGSADDWSITVATFRNLDDAGQVGYDGAAAKMSAGVLMHLTPELCKALTDQAAAKTS